MGEWILIIYGVALLAICMILGTTIGHLLGLVLGLEGVNVGGVGIAMLLLVFITNYLKQRKQLDFDSERGISFWGAMYIPVVVAMAASQDVAGAISGGPMAILAGTVAIAISFMLVPVLSKFGKQDVETLDDLEEQVN